jgi:glycosyltransferase involved in cell wall biosynthesis
VIRHYDPEAGKTPCEPSLNRKIKKNPLTCLERNFAWKTGAWKSKALLQWLDAFKPDIVLLQVGDFPFMFDWATWIAKRENAKFVIFSTEDYYFKTWNYLGDENGHKRLYPLFHKKYVNALTKGVAKAELCIYNSEMLKDDFIQALPHKKTAVVYTPTAWKPTSYASNKDKLIVSYFGSLACNRTSSLIEIAKELNALGKPFEFTVYGVGAAREDIESINHCPNMVYHQPVPYDEVRNIANKSDLLVHAESFDDFDIKERRHEFSTKTADCLASGRCFLVYAPSSSAFVQYLIAHKAAYVATDKEQLVGELKDILSCPASRTKYLANAKKTVAEFHSIARNEEKIQELLLDLTSKKIN